MDAEGVLHTSVDLGSASPDALRELAHRMTRIEASSGQQIYAEGDSADDAYLIESGTIHIIVGQPGDEGSYVAEVGPGELLGEMTAFTDRPRTTDAVATTNSVLWRIPVEDLRDFLLREPEATFKMMRTAMELVLEKDLTVVMGRLQTYELRKAVDLEQRTAEQLREGTQMRDERVAMMAHDIRSPITVIQGCVEVLKQHGEALEPERRERLLDAIYRQGRGLLDLVNDALQVTSIEAGSVRYDIESFDIAELARHMVDDLLHADQTLEVEVTAPDDLPAASGDKRHHRRILFNLLSNAIKFSQPGSPIRVALSTQDAVVRVDVADSGIGIAKADAARLFEKYARVDRPSDQLQPESTGLGLYICRSLVEAQGGTIWVESEPGRGSTFSYTLPIA
jgi:signal transduction histidine kinase